MDNHHRRRRSVTDDDDMITNLPEDLINPILERLPVKDAVRTSVLSKRWRYRWTTMRTLDFHFGFSGQFLNIGAYQHNGFTRVISQIMIHHQGPISTFLLHIPKEIVLHSFQEVDLWMLILSRNNLRVLLFRNSNRIYQIPPSVFSCLELRVLGLRGCIFNPPLEFKGFPNLQDINLQKVIFGGNLGGTVINLPQLKNLSLHTCLNLNNFNIMAVKLQHLLVFGCPDAMLLRLLHSKHLSAVHICLGKSMQGLQVERYSLARMLSNLPKLVTFNIDGYFLKFLAAQKFPSLLPHAIIHLQLLKFQRFSFGDLDQVQGALCILRNSPNLKGLGVTHVQMGPEADLELTSNYIESLDSLDQTLFMLKTVEMISLEGSRPELLFVKLLLDHSPHLESMIIRPSATVDAEKRLNIAKDVMLFPRASSKAKMVYLDPEP
ncbi:putative F-box domain, FBD domain, leucine-rich repeat domain superfamily [Helianthus annuus]|uniref:Putative F-box domain, FBD domain, Leucine-rich repeat domain, L domain-like protein n=1 Tax=Helianthus annuus TaxID=4232 RepID=A0A251VRU7_HELAN|nr:F-box/FBD/LRR-repeat protein At1g13570 [Helianthus annuus]KAJ0612087.1 putative F-box domain, FBD domain, leucine-rich repeat domain superfamily [Helianthus annuus]KAJ0627440.1 putative F-box domain, FBD domain, leucine-rich repeat domain superfamily [Helianthus annuus]KAJ0948620.1 putative F-box domain, FBD domain, leucine-rich repeat domain superfamily [Helianthus annuus]